MYPARAEEVRAGLRSGRSQRPRRSTPEGHRSADNWSIWRMDLAAESAAGGAGAVQRHRWAAAMVHPLSDGGVGTPATFIEKRFKLEQVTGGEVLRISALGL